MKLSFNVRGVPVPQGSMRHVGGGRLIHSRKLTDWRTVVAIAARNMARAAGWAVSDLPLRMRLTFTLPAPQRPLHRGRASTKPDLDKLVRAIGDALEGVLYSQDSRIVEVTARKVHGPEPGVAVEIEECP